MPQGGSEVVGSGEAFGRRKADAVGGRIVEGADAADFDRGRDGREGLVLQRGSKDRIDDRSL